jgi:hypothetical protein
MGGTLMKRKFILMIAVFAVLAANGLNVVAQVRRVQMHIGGYLCGN